MNHSIGYSAPYFTEPIPFRHVAYFDPAEGHVPNPGMGIVCYGFSDHMYVLGSQKQDPIELDRETFERMVQLPYCDNIYLRPEWRDIQKEKGKLSLPPFWEWAMEAVEKYDKKWSFRIMATCPHSQYETSLPEYLNEKTEMLPYDNSGYGGPETKYFPAYDDVFMDNWQEMLNLLGEKYDNDPNLEFGDISGYGLWGEWHHGKQKNIIQTEAHRPIVWRFIDDHMSAFPNTPAAMLMTPGEQKFKDEAMYYALEKGCWMRRDSFHPGYTPWEYRIAKEAAHPGAAYVYEPGYHPDSVAKPPYSPERTFETAYQSFLDIGVSYVGLGFNPWHAIIAHTNHSGLMKKIVSKIGYRVRPSLVWLMRSAKKVKKWITVGLINDGVAPVTGALKIKAVFDDGPALEADVPAGKPSPGLIELVNMDLPEDFNRFGNSNTFTLTATTVIGKKVHPVRWAVPPEQADDRERYVLRCPVMEAIE